jgi:GTP-binding protein Era
MSGEGHCGFVAVVGRPNCGKSTLVNALVGEKVSIVTDRPQTTRHRVLGILTRPPDQAIFVDTPGLHAEARKLINRTMNRAAASSVTDADLVLFVIEATGWRREDEHALGRIREAGRPTVLIVNKVDLARPRTRLIPVLEEAAARHEFAEIIPVSALTGENLPELLAQIWRFLPEGPMLFPPEAHTDRSQRFRVAEVIREKLMAALRREVPYGLEVEIETFDESGSQVQVLATIWVSKESQRPIVVGRGGEMLRRVGQEARLELVKLLGRRVHLATHVKVRRNWADDARALRQLGYDLDT